MASLPSRAQGRCPVSPTSPRRAGGGGGADAGWGGREGGRCLSSGRCHHPWRLPGLPLPQGVTQRQGAKPGQRCGPRTLPTPLKPAQREASCSQRKRPPIRSKRGTGAPCSTVSYPVIQSLGSVGPEPQLGWTPSCPPQRHCPSLGGGLPRRPLLCQHPAPSIARTTRSCTHSGAQAHTSAHSLLLSYLGPWHMPTCPTHTALHVPGPKPPHLHPPTHTHTASAHRGAHLGPGRTGLTTQMPPRLTTLPS